MRVLITRPEPGAARTADRLRSLGHEPVMLPLTRTVGRRDGLLRLDAQEAGAFAATSGAAIRHWREVGIAPGRLQTTFYAVGTATGKVAMQAGFSAVRRGSADAAALASTIVADYRSGRLPVTQSKPLVYLAGSTRKNTFEADLAAASVPFRTIEIYEIEIISHSTDYLQNVFVDDPVDAVLFYSTVAASCFFDVAAGAKFDKALNNINYICMGSSILAAIPEAFIAQSAVAEQPDEPSLFQLLDRIAQDKI
ncbi:uroporphyrinogen-III synthase [Hoeflea sp. WL0058]|uniref:Uroporphyrinogen-III synthase n=1 Tax=Flavimaribacter sediminis TaxID=2865987 RepID=A0AAE2ZLL8_9HYPH|nr:uroporphyrinogen-III synthase [Flavimaribacter sediminis]